MAIKAEISFKVFHQGKRIYSQVKVTTVNNWVQLAPAIIAQVEKEYPDITSATVVFDEAYPQIGIALKVANHNGRTFKLEINRL